MQDFFYLFLGILLVLAFSARELWRKDLSILFFLFVVFISGWAGGVLINRSIFEIFSVGGWSVGEDVTMVTSMLFGLVNFFVGLHEGVEDNAL